MKEVIQQDKKEQDTQQQLFTDLLAFLRKDLEQRKLDCELAKKNRNRKAG